MVKLVIASNNSKKRQEMETILASMNFHVLTAKETIHVDVTEDADSFAGNARKKAVAFARANQCAAIADDSGLCVDALAGAPGVHSSRFAGDHASDANNNAKLLQCMENITHRDACFVCAIHLALPDGRAFTAQGRVDGMIETQLSGNAGFGYDPLFYCPELGKVFAQASASEKATVSHRSRALQSLASFWG